MATQDVTPTVLGDGTIAELAEAVRGEVIRARRPGLRRGARDLERRARPPPGADRALRGRRRRACARSSSPAARTCAVAVRGGSHSIPGFSTVDGGIVIDLLADAGHPRRPATAHRAARRAACTWGAFDHETQAFGLAVTGGLVSTHRLAGFTLGGGIGWLMRKYGLTCDNLISADVVTADGQLVHRERRARTPSCSGACAAAAATSASLTVARVPAAPGRPDRRWAARSFYPGERAGEILRFYRDFVRDVPDELTTVANLLDRPAGAVPPRGVARQAADRADRRATPGRSRTASRRCGRCASSAIRSPT